MKITLNGELHETAARNIAGLVEELGLPAPTLLIEHDGQALRREEWAGSALSESSRVEVMRIAAGG